MARVLVVDDEPDIRFFVQLNLELEGHEVTTAANGAEALDAARTVHPDVVLLDVMMPVADGWEVLATLKQEPDEALKTVPVIMMTALGAERDRIRGGIEGAVRYLVKPATPEELTEAVDAALQGDPEPVQRRRSQRAALEKLARLESGEDGSRHADAPRPRLSRLEHGRWQAGTGERPSVGPVTLEGLTDRQLELLTALRGADSVSAAAATLGMSRSNIYASLRRIGRKAGMPDVRELLRRLRDGTAVLPER